MHVDKFFKANRLSNAIAQSEFSILTYVTENIFTISVLFDRPFQTKNIEHSSS